MSAPFSAQTNELKARFPSIVFTDQDSLYRYSFDGLKISFLPDAVIVPETHDCIGEILKLANTGLVPITTRGVGSTLTGSATPNRGGWVLDLHKLNSIDINPSTRMAEVGCGAVVKDIQDAAAAVGLFYPPDPSSYKWCTIGGNIACNAGGLRCVKYGVTRDYVIGLKGYLASGEYVEWAKPVRKFATAYNIRDLWIGSEGTLGIITSATLRLIPSPQFRKTVLIGFDNESKALSAILELMQSRVTPSIMEFIDKLSVKGAQETVGRSFFSELPDACVVLLEIDGRDEKQLEEEMSEIRVWIEKHTNLARFASSDEEAETLWEVRRKCSGAMFKLGNSKLNEDVVVPLYHMPELVQGIAALRKKTQVPIAVFGHAGDGNLHVNIMYNREDSEMANKAQQCLQALMEKVVSLDGAISGEHGVGLAKSYFVSLQFSKTQIELMRDLKRVFDPNLILNPGKPFEKFSPWEHHREEYRFPWDKN